MTGETCVYLPIDEMRIMSGWTDWWTARAWEAATTK